MTVLPKTNFVFLRWAVVAMDALCIWFSIVSVQNAISGSLVAGLVGFVNWLTIGVGLYRLMQWGRWLALAVLWLIVFFTLSPFGEMSTFAMINGEAPPLPIWEELAKYIAPYGVGTVFFIEVLYAYRGEFKFSRDGQAAGDRASSPPTPPRSWILWIIAVIAVPTLIVFLSIRDMRLSGGCIKWDPGSTSTFRIIPTLIAIILGSLLFLRAAPANASRRHLIVRVAIYVTINLLFYSGIKNYLWYTNHC
jgi:hypothetical protein